MTSGRFSFSGRKILKGKKEYEKSIYLEHVFITGKHSLTAIHLDSFSHTEDRMGMPSAQTLNQELPFGHMVNTRFPVLSLTKNG